MSVSWVLLIILLISSIPVIVIFVWFKLAKYQFSVYWFLFALLAGAAAVFPALLLQNALALEFLIQDGRAVLFYHHFIRIAFTEELSRLLVLVVFFWGWALFSKKDTGQFTAEEHSPFINRIKKASAAGLVAGLGFALLENAMVAASDPSLLPLRIILTTAVHGACGSRVGAAAVMLRSKRLRAFLRFLSAVAIHGIYNLMIDIPGSSQIIAILIALSALFTTVVAIRGGWHENLSENTPSNQ